MQYIEEPLVGPFEEKILTSEFDNSGDVYYRDYSFIDRPFTIQEINNEQEKRKNDILQYTSRVPIITKKQQYANKARGISQHRKKSFATQITGKETNPNSSNLIRVDRNKMVINESPYTEVPYIKTSVPYTHTHTSSNNIYTDGNMISTRKPVDISNIVQIPQVENRYISKPETILEGGILYAGTKFIPEVTERDDYNPSLYKLSEKAIVESGFAEHFQINVKETYTEEELQELTGKTMNELYPFMPTWERNSFNNGIIWSPENGGNMGTFVTQPNQYNNSGEFLISMYNRANYQYDPVSNKFFSGVVKVIWFIPENKPPKIYGLYPNQYNP